MDVGDGAPRQGHGQVPDAGPAGSEGVRPMGGDRLGPKASGQHVVQDGQVVRGEVPEDVDVGLHQPQVDPDGVDEEDLADQAVGDHLGDPLHGRGVAVRVVAHQDQALLTGDPGHLRRAI